MSAFVPDVARTASLLARIRLELAQRPNAPDESEDAPARSDRRGLQIRNEQSPRDVPLERRRRNARQVIYRVAVVGR